MLQDGVHGSRSPKLAVARRYAFRVELFRDLGVRQALALSRLSTQLANPLHDSRFAAFEMRAITVRRFDR